MPLLAWILIFTALGGVLSALAASVFLAAPESLRVRALPYLVSFATGALLSAALLGLLPHAIEGAGIDNAHKIGLTLLLGLLIFFVLEKLVLWRHCHQDACEGHVPHGQGFLLQADDDQPPHDQPPYDRPRHDQTRPDARPHGQARHAHSPLTPGRVHAQEPGCGHAHARAAVHAVARGPTLGAVRASVQAQVANRTWQDGRDQASAALILIGDGFHNVLDGILIAAAFLTDVHLGVVTALAVFTHEIPQEVGDLAVLLHSGMSRLKAMLLNLATSLTSVVGGVIAYFALASVAEALPYALALAASSFLYIAVADLIPGLHKRVDPGSSVRQFLFIVMGGVAIFLGHVLAH